MTDLLGNQSNLTAGLTTLIFGGGLLLGSILGVLLGSLLGRLQQKQQAQTEQQRLQIQLAEQAEARKHLMDVQATLRTELQTNQAELHATREALTQQRETRAQLEKTLSTLQEETQTWKNQLTQQWQQQFEAFMLKQLGSAETQFKEQAGKELQEKQQLFEKRFDELLKPLKETIENYHKGVKIVEEKHFEQTSKVLSEVEQLRLSNHRLTQTLSQNKGVGDWGELELIRLLEASGLKETLHFVKQEALEADRKRPDITVLLPNNRVIFIDAKALQLNVEECIPLTEPEQELQRKKRLAKSLKEAMKGLSSREYHAKSQNSPDFVVLYVPRESMLSAALEIEPSLFDEAYQKKVILSGPLNLIALLKIVWLGWTQAELSKNASEILKIGTQIYKKATLVSDSFQTIGKKLEESTKAYNQAVTSFNGQGGLLPQVSKLEAFGCDQAGKGILTHFQPIENTPNRLEKELPEKVPSEIPSVSSPLTN